ncbi:heavy metal-binding domain-containing protein [Ferrimonas sp. YFM]|uniref:heavy metal-binding domain-containing protein n=1 Tax=Ferrimonas sp. YFM TaxID=3028878 RepID=UPI0025737F70|nr:heavy metal-binding domain-containing protein [Ferrimonas sp. YFM]BDY03109.1 hypothetical protein F0521_01500 [Ferrimonas sp. YFM]
MNKFFAAVALMAALIATPFSAQVQAHAEGHGAHAAAEATHACPMHPKVKGVAGDECPKCGMALTPVAAKGHGHHKHQHAKHDCDKANCPNKAKHAKHDCDKANCPNKGKHAKHDCDKANCPNKDKHAKHQHKHDCANCPKMSGKGAHYTHACPMNPKIVGFEGDSCPKCGMDLEPVAKADRQAYTHACPMNPKIRGFEGDSCPKCGMDLEPMAQAGKGHSHH